MTEDISLLKLWQRCAEPGQKTGNAACSVTLEHYGEANVIFRTKGNIELLWNSGTYYHSIFFGRELDQVRLV